MNNMTALVSCFARAYHYKNNEEWIFKDEIAARMLTEKEYAAVSSNMVDGISYFSPSFNGTKEEALAFIVNHQLAPSVLARSAFCEQALDNAILLGCKEYVIFAAGYDTYSFRTNADNLLIFELDLPEIIADKKNRVQTAGLIERCKTVYIPCNLSERSWVKSLVDHGFNKHNPCFGSLLGISYYLTKNDLKILLEDISELWCEGSSICFDYPTYDEGIESVKNQELAHGAGEQMLAKYTYAEIESLLSDCGFLIYEHHDNESATDEFFKRYNDENPDYVMHAPKGVNYCLAVKKG